MILLARYTKELSARSILSILRLKMPHDPTNLLNSNEMLTLLLKPRDSWQTETLARHLVDLYGTTDTRLERE